MTGPTSTHSAEQPQTTQLPTEGEKVAQISTATAGTHGCTRCTNRWGGLNTAHCAACHETFTGLTAFDAHRTGSHANSTRHCANPTDVGLVNAGRAYPCWGFPSDGKHWFSSADPA